MKICYIASAGSIHTQRWVKYFANRGHEVQLVSPTLLGDGDIGRAELHMLKRFPLQVKGISFLINFLSYIIQSRGLIKKIKPDILHAHYVTDCGFIGALSGFHPFVLSAWGSDILINPKRYRVYKTLTKYTLKRADLITTDGNNTMEEMIRLGTVSGKLKLILHGVNSQEFSPKQLNEELRQKMKVSDSPTIISTRNLKPVYDVGTLVRAVPLVLERVPGTKFIIAGDGKERDYLENLARSLHVLDSISFLGQIPHDEIPYYLTLADVYISTSLSEGGSSVSLIEAMSCGLAPIVTNVGDVARWIKDGENGFIIPTKRPDLLAEKIIYLLENKELRDEMGKANRQLVEERADYEKEMGKMGELYEKLIRENKR